MNKSKIIKGVSIGLLGSLLVGSAGVAITEVTTDHLNEKCPLCNVLGLKHQSKIINKTLDDYLAIYYSEIPFIPEGYKKENDGIAYKYVEPTEHIVNGETIYTVPEGYVLEGNKGVKTFEVSERVEVYEKDGTFEQPVRIFR